MNYFNPETLENIRLIGSMLVSIGLILLFVYLTVSYYCHKELIVQKNAEISAFSEQVKFLQDCIHRSAVTITELRAKIDGQNLVMRISDDICVEMFNESETLKEKLNSNNPVKNEKTIIPNI